MTDIQKEIDEKLKSATRIEPNKVTDPEGYKLWSFERYMESPLIKQRMAQWLKAGNPMNHFPVAYDTKTQTWHYINRESRRK